MSDFFTKNNTVEVGPGPNREIEWMVVQTPTDINGVTQCCTVSAVSSYAALKKAERFIPEINTQKCVCYPNPVLLIKFKE